MNDDNTGDPQNQFMPLLAAAVMAHELFRSYVEAGFTESQALYLIGQVLTASVRGQQP